jgi:hypothetical protein
VLTRRQFVKAALAAGAAAAMPPAMEALWSPARAASAEGPAFFFDPQQWSTCAALCARIVPTGADPATDPGATEAWAVQFIDRFLSAFELPAAVATNPAIWVQGRWSGRNPFLGEGGEPSASFPPDDFLQDGQGRFLGLTPAQELSWRCQIYGTAALEAAPAWAQPWADQVRAGLIPSPAPAAGLRQAYLDGLAAFDAWSRSLFGVGYAETAPAEQDLLLEVAGDVVLGAVSSALPVTLPEPAPPPAAVALFPIISLHTFQATYGIPEYAWRNQVNDPSVIRGEGTAQWRAIRYDGDTEPLGNSLFDPDLYGPGEGPNRGFGAEPGSEDARAGVFVPFGGYREFRPVSTLGPGGSVLSAAGAEALEQMLNQMGVRAK